MGGDYLDSDHVTLRRARRIRIQSRPEMWFSIDGEPVGEEPITFTAVPRALRVVVGAEYRPDPATSS
jgi:diacylglycerol kinase (ATP)